MLSLAALLGGTFGPACGGSAETETAAGDDAGAGRTGGSGGGAASTDGGGGSNLDGGIDGEPPRIELPPRPTWTPSFPLGAAGWRNSTVPFCSDEVANLDPRVWSTDGLVYVLVSSDCSGLRTCNASSYAVETVYRNNGSGWARIYRQVDSVATDITGYSDGRAVLLGGAGCTVRQVDPSGSATCLWTGSTSFFASIGTVADNGDLLVLGGYRDRPGALELWSFDGAIWTSLHAFPGEWIFAFTGSGTAAVVAGNNVAWTFDLTQGTATAVPDLPAAHYFSAWTYGSNDVLLGNASGGLAHYDGSQWALTDTLFNDALYGMWGAKDGTVFIYSKAAFGRWKAGSFDTIFTTSQSAYLSSHYFNDIWGNSSSEVFLAVNDRAFGSYTCGSTFLVWFDGTTFHQF